MRFPSVDTPIRRLLHDSAEQSDTDRLTYVKSFLVLRLLVGVVGVSLPFVLVFGDRALPGSQGLRGSLSGYYHSGMRDVFVGSLYAVAIFLVTYMAFYYVWDNILSIVAGIAALGVALFPTAGGDPLTPLQRMWGEPVVSRVHFVCAVAFILSLAAISFLFGYREGRKAGSTRNQQKRWRGLHWLCGVAIVVAVVAVAAAKGFGWFGDHAVFYGEAVAVLAFGVSWLTKGAEWTILLRPQPTPPAPEREHPLEPQILG